MTAEIRIDVGERLRVALRQPYAQGGGAALTAALSGLHIADLAEAMRDLAPPEGLAIFNWLDNERASDLLSELEPDLVRYLLDNAPPLRIAELLELMEVDDVVDVVEEASPEQAEEMLGHLARRSPEDADEVRDALAYPDGTAGRLMTDAFLSVSPDSTVSQTLMRIRSSASEIETLTDIYVQYDPSVEGPLLGVLSLRDLILANPRQKIREIMVDDPVTCAVGTDQSEAAREIAKYDLYALPVLDDRGYMVGIVTVDDMIDVLIEEFNEDYLKLVGSDAEEMDRRSPLQVARLRLPWLLGTMGIELFAGVVIAHFANVLKEVVLLASFMPVISAISGNVGLQAAAIVVRGLDTGHVKMNRWARAVSKELTASLIMATVCGIVLGLVAVGWSGKASFGVVIGGAMTCSMLTAGFLGTVVPMLSKRAGFDPAASAGPFETAFQDVIGFAVFLWLASMLMHWLK
jgi:magnesium transporter